MRREQRVSFPGQLRGLLLRPFLCPPSRILPGTPHSSRLTSSAGNRESSIICHLFVFPSLKQEQGWRIGEPQRLQSGASLEKMRRWTGKRGGAMLIPTQLLISVGLRPKFDRKQPASQYQKMLKSQIGAPSQPSLEAAIRTGERFAGWAGRQSEAAFSAPPYLHLLFELGESRFLRPLSQRASLPLSPQSFG